MFALPSGGFIIDTPGIRGFGVTDMDKNEIGLYFTDIFNLSPIVRFYNCTHVHEPGCAVIEACKKGILHESRYRSYLKFISNEKANTGLLKLFILLADFTLIIGIIFYFDSS